MPAILAVKHNFWFSKVNIKKATLTGGFLLSGVLFRYFNQTDYLLQREFIVCRRAAFQ